MRRALCLLLAAGCGKAPAPREEPKPVTAPTAIAADAASSEAMPAADAAAPPVLPESVAVPTDPKALQAWLVAGHYKQWAQESKSHPSEGPHGDAVKTFLSPQLAASLAKGGAHPRGVAAVKELYTGKRLAHSGWAVSVKLDADSADGKNWYWYEVFSTKPGAKPAYAGKGKQLCRECHEGGGIDQVLIIFPLQ